MIPQLLNVNGGQPFGAAPLLNVNVSILPIREWSAWQWFCVCGAAACLWVQWKCARMEWEDYVANNKRKRQEGQNPCQSPKRPGLPISALDSKGQSVNLPAQRHGEKTLCLGNSSNLLRGGVQLPDGSQQIVGLLDQPLRILLHPLRLLRCLLGNLSVRLRDLYKPCRLFGKPFRLLRQLLGSKLLDSGGETKPHLATGLSNRRKLLNALRFVHLRNLAGDIHGSDTVPPNARAEWWRATRSQFAN